MANFMVEGMLPMNSVINDRWQIEEKIGRGGFGEVYRCRDTEKNRLVALKLVPKTAVAGLNQLYRESKALRVIQGKTFFTRYYSYKRLLLFDILVMELLGPNLKELKKAYPDKKFPVGITLSMGRMMLKSVEWLHDAGYLHRDIKPNNFAIGLGKKSDRVFLIDFGLAKRYVYDSGDERDLRFKVSFKGTSKYASANVLFRKDPGRRDDLISLFYTLVELSASKLPWKKITDHKQLARMKESYDCSALIAGFPETFRQFFDHLENLDAFQKPDYGFLLSVLEACRIERGQDIYDVETAATVKGPVQISERSLSSLSMSSRSTITGENTSVYDKDFQDVESD